MTDSFDRMKAQKDRILATAGDRIFARIVTPIYDRLAAINDGVEMGDDGYARFSSTNDAERLRELVQELEPVALAWHDECAERELGPATAATTEES